MRKWLLLGIASWLACGDDDELRPAAGLDASAGLLDAAWPSVIDAALGEAAVSEPSPSDGACGSVREESVAVTSARHVSGDVQYPDLPPAGGDHAPCWARFGVHESELADERWVHNLEHGAVVFLYRCPEGCARELSELAALTRTRPFALLTPYSGLPTRFAAVSWGQRLLSDCLDLAAFERFYAAHADDGPESSTASPPAGCP